MSNTITVHTFQKDHYFEYHFIERYEPVSGDPHEVLFAYKDFTGITRSLEEGDMFLISASGKVHPLEGMDTKKMAEFLTPMCEVRITRGQQLDRHILRTLWTERSIRFLKAPLTHNNRPRLYMDHVLELINVGIPRTFDLYEKDEIAANILEPLGITIEGVNDIPPTNRLPTRSVLRKYWDATQPSNGLLHIEYDERTRGALRLDFNGFEEYLHILWEEYMAGGFAFGANREARRKAIAHIANLLRRIGIGWGSRWLDT